MDKINKLRKEGAMVNFLGNKSYIAKTECEVIHVHEGNKFAIITHPDGIFMSNEPFAKGFKPKRNDKFIGCIRVALDKGQIQLLKLEK